MDPFIGEIRMFGGNFAPVDWSFCDGSIIQISQNDTLFSLIGTTYGGDGSTTFQLPDLRGRVPVHQGPNYPMGLMGGVEAVALNANQLPSHTHGVPAGGPGNLTTPKGTYLANSPGSNQFYADPSNGAAAMAAGTTTADGGSNQAHSNMQPYLCYTFIIALAGVYPSRN